MFLDDMGFPNSNVLRTTINKMSENDPLIVIKWNENRLATEYAANPEHTKAILVEAILASGGTNEGDEDFIFGFRSIKDICLARQNIPMWSHSLGPIGRNLAGNPPNAPEAIGIAFLIVGTSGIPDVAIEPFFETM
mmetsp:Transcript_14815/g.20350  ORF Transcript_14815/g.20350 Transcript_14815/m.20350 type:complete len:136 (+) Transcript_14815:152-559(+)